MKQPHSDFTFRLVGRSVGSLDSAYDASAAANKVFAGHGHVRVSASIHPSRTHGLWIFWRMHFPYTCEHMPGDVALWYLRPSVDTSNSPSEIETLYI